jgi:uncharacterized OsmC-like protein
VLTTSSAPTASVVYRSIVQIEPGAAKLKMVQLPEESAAVPMGVHGAIAAHYKLADGAFTPHASTIDYIVGATGGCLMGTLNGALLARQIPTGDRRLTGEAVGEIEVEDGVLVIRRIRFTAILRGAAEHRETVERVAMIYPAQCPVYRSLQNAIAISTELKYEID